MLKSYWKTRNTELQVSPVHEEFAKFNHVNERMDIKKNMTNECLRMLTTGISFLGNYEYKYREQHGLPKGDMKS